MRNLAIAGGTILGAAVATPILIGILGAVGFGAGGIAAGTSMLNIKCI